MVELLAEGTRSSSMLASSRGCLGFPITWRLSSKSEEVLFPDFLNAWAQRSQNGTFAFFWLNSHQLSLVSRKKEHNKLYFLVGRVAYADGDGWNYLGTSLQTR